MEIVMIDKFGGGEGAERRRAEMVNAAGRWFEGLERRLGGREWIACDEFTVADILLATVLRQVRKTDLFEPYPRLTAYYARALARPAWQRTLNLYAKRLDVSVADIR
jgi:glutathione S-transferase